MSVMPYAGTSGFARNSDTSREAAEALDSSGATTRWRHKALGLLAEVREEGITGRELSDYFDIDYTRGGPVLSRLHLEGAVCRLKDRRGKGELYVLPQYVNGRDLSERGHHGVNRDAVLDEAAAALRAHKVNCYSCSVGHLEQVIDSLRSIP